MNGYLTVLLSSLQLADKGFHVYAPDWLGFGFSDKPAPGYEFTYKGVHNSTC